MSTPRFLRNLAEEPRLEVVRGARVQAQLVVSGANPPLTPAGVHVEDTTIIRAEVPFLAVVALFLLFVAVERLAEGAGEGAGRHVDVVAETGAVEVGLGVELERAHALTKSGPMRDQRFSFGQSWR